MSAFNRWWSSSKYMQVVFSSEETKQVARDAWFAAVLAEREACAVIAYNGCLVPPDGGSPSEAEVMLCDAIAAAIRARNHDA